MYSLLLSLYSLIICSCASVQAEIEPFQLIALQDSRFGYINIQTSFPDNTPLKVLVKQGNRLVISAILHAKKGQITWQSPPLPPGHYEIIYNLPDAYPPVPYDRVILIKGKHLLINTQLVKISTINVMENTPEAVSLPKTTADSQLKTVHVNGGKTIIGDASSEQKINELPAKIVTVDPFEIGIYEVTNAQYATWLNTAFKNGIVTYISEADQRGLVVDMEGNLVCKTFENDPYSQIHAQYRTSNHVKFFSLPGKDVYPVINVSWKGAMMFCQFYKCRLPTEAEWETAASMAITASDVPLKKFIYGFGQDKIDPSWANYKINDRPIQKFQVLTTPVGFYDGIHLLPLRINDPHQQTTHLATSPCGAFDMSGNVWEWVADWYDDGYYANMTDNNPQGPSTGYSKVVKGGCYDSLTSGVRVTERLGLPLNYADAYTGFRVAR